MWSKMTLCFCWTLADIILGDDAGGLQKNFSKKLLDAGRFILIFYIQYYLIVSLYIYIKIYILVLWGLRPAFVYKQLILLNFQKKSGLRPAFLCSRPQYPTNNANLSTPPKYYSHPLVLTHPPISSPKFPKAVGLPLPQD